LAVEAVTGFLDVGNTKSFPNTHSYTGLRLIDDNENTHTNAEIVAWIELRQPVTRGKLLGEFGDLDYEQLQCWLSELQLKHKLFEVNPETYYTTTEERK
jgi:hypothetical protein